MSGAENCVLVKCRDGCPISFRSLASKFKIGYDCKVTFEDGSSKSYDVEILRLAFGFFKLFCSGRSSFVFPGMPSRTFWQLMNCFRNGTTRIQKCDLDLFHY